MRIAIFGGRFDPPHVWHFLAASHVVENEKNIDEVWLMPDYQNAFKPIYTSHADRLAMLSFHTDKNVVCSDYALKRRVPTFAYDVIKGLENTTDNEYAWIIGEDNLKKLNKWKDIDSLLVSTEFIVIPRPGCETTFLPKGCRMVRGECTTSNLSSSVIRKRVKKGSSIKGLVLPEVEEYIKKHRLYK